VEWSLVKLSKCWVDYMPNNTYFIKINSRHLSFGMEILKLYYVLGLDL
jgi:hypothetical protein